MKHLRYVLKGGLSVALLWYVLASVGWTDLIRELRGVQPGYAAAFVLAGGLQILVSSWKWQVLSRARGLSLSLAGAFVLYLKGLFFSQLLPTSVGGDAVRAYELGRSENDLPTALASVFMERFTGLVVLGLFAAVAIPLTPLLFDHEGVKSFLVITLVAFLVGTWLVLSGQARRWLERRLRGKWASALIRKGGLVQERIAAYRHHRRELAESLALSVLFYVLAAANLWLAGMTFGVALSPLLLPGALALLLLIFLVPISVGGIGLHEWGFVQVLALIGAPPAVGLAIGLLHRGRSVGFAVVGGAFYPFEAIRAAIGGDRPVAAVAADAASRRSDQEEEHASRVAATSEPGP